MRIKKILPVKKETLKKTHNPNLILTLACLKCYIIIILISNSSNYN